jgi:hypothetical protein
MYEVLTTMLPPPLLLLLLLLAGTLMVKDKSHLLLEELYKHHSLLTRMMPLLLLLLLLKGTLMVKDKSHLLLEEFYERHTLLTPQQKEETGDWWVPQLQLIFRNTCNRSGRNWQSIMVDCAWR